MHLCCCLQVWQLLLATVALPQQLRCPCCHQHSHNTPNHPWCNSNGNSTVSRTQLRAAGQQQQQQRQQQRQQRQRQRQQRQRQRPCPAPSWSGTSLLPSVLHQPGSNLSHRHLQLERQPNRIIFWGDSASRWRLSQQIGGWQSSTPRQYISADIRQYI